VSTTCVAMATVDSVSIEPSVFYSDSQTISVVFNVNNLATDGSTYTLTLLDLPTIFSLQTVANCTDTLKCDPPNNNKYTFTPTLPAGTIKFVFSNSNIIVLESYSWELKKGSCPGKLDSCYLSNTETFQVTPGNPTFNLLLRDFNTGKEETKFGKTSPVQIAIEQLWDNVDDDKKDYISCTYTIKKAGTVQKTNTVTSWQANETKTDHTWETFTISDLSGADDYDIYATCNDGHLDSQEQHVGFTYEDKVPEVDVITFLPDKVYPDKKVKCNATFIDLDDQATTVTGTYRWYKNGTEVTSVTGNEFDCSTNSCKSGDEIKCGVTPKNSQSGQEEFNKLNVSSYFSDVKISAPYKLQVNQEDSFNVTMNYSGTGTLSYSWSFGDGSSSTEKSPKHAFASKGTQNITLNVTDGTSTATDSVSLDVVDADLIINVKSPTINQELVKGDSLNVKASLTDNTGSPIVDGNVIANLKSGDKIFATSQLTSNAGIFEGSIPISYLVPSTLELEISANYTKSGVSLTNKKIVPLTSTPIDSLQPLFDFDLKYLEPKENSFTVGNVINSIKVCFKLPDNTFDDAMQGKLILSAAKDYEFKLDEIKDKCYNLYPDYRIPKEDLDTGITLKFKETKDSYDNYIKASNVKKFEVIPLPKVFDLVLIEPSIEKTNYGQIVFIKAKPVIRDGYSFSDLKELKAEILYSGKTYDLSFDDLNSEKIFSGSFLPNLENTINFKVFASGTYKGTLVEESVNKTLIATNELKVTLLSPNESGIIDELGKVIISVNYQNNLVYDGNEISLNLNDKNTIFTKINDGKYAGAFASDSSDVGFFKSGALKIVGQDSKGNGINYGTDIPTMSWKMPMFVYDIFAGIIIIIIVMAIVMTRISSKTRKLAQMYANKSSEELQDELTVAKQTLGELQRKFFKQEVSEDVFKTQKIELEKKVALLEGKLKTEDLREQKVHDASKEYVNNMPDNMREQLEKKLNLQSDVYTKYKEDIDTLSAKLKPYKDKYSPDDMRIAIKQSKELPEDIIDKIIGKIYD